MKMLNNEIKTCINEFAKNNGISLNSELSKYDDFGKVCIDIVSTINISHIGNLFNSLTKLANKEYSPILNERCNEDLVLDLLLKLEKLYGLNIQKIQLKYSLKDKELFLKYQEENHKNGIYDLNILDSQMKEFKSELELTQGFIKVLDNTDELITIISESKDTFAAAQNLMEKYSLSNDVALDIMNCSLLSLNKEKKALYKKEEKIIKNKIMSINELINRIKL